MAEQPVVFRGLRGRTLEDQTKAIENGYESMQDYAIDELGRLLLELTQRVEALEQQVVRQRAAQGSSVWRDRDAGA